MPTASVPRLDISREEAMRAVRQELGKDYTVELGIARHVTSAIAKAPQGQEPGPVSAGQ